MYLPDPSAVVHITVARFETHLVASKMSSNFFFSAAGSARGQLDSSWWQKMTFSRMALETPSCLGTSSSSSEHFVEMALRFYSPFALVS